MGGLFALIRERAAAAAAAGSTSSFVATLAQVEADAPDLSVGWSTADRTTVYAAILDAVDVSTDGATFPLLHAGRQSPFYVDVDRVLGTSGAARDLLVAALADVARLLDVTCVASLVSPTGLLGAAGLALAVADRSPCAAAFVTRAAGGAVRVTGAVRTLAGARTLVVGDVMTSGASAVTVAAALRARGATVVGVVHVVDRGEGGAERLAQEGLPGVALVSRTSFRAFCESVRRRGERATASQVDAVLAATRRIEVVEHRLGAEVAERPVVMVAPGLAPPLDAFGRVVLPERDAHTARLRDLVHAAGRAQCPFVVVPELAVTAEFAAELRALAGPAGVTFIGGVEYDASGRNAAVVAWSGGEVRQLKLVRSPYDRDDMICGDTVGVFTQSAVGRFAVLVCADELDWDVARVLAGQVDVVFVIARNRAVGTASHIAVALAYWLRAYVLYVNAAEAGWSFLAAPLKGHHKLVRLPGDDVLQVPLDTAALRDPALVVRRVSFGADW